MTSPAAIDAPRTLRCTPSGWRTDPAADGAPESPTWREHAPRVDDAPRARERGLGQPQRGVDRAEDAGEVALRGAGRVIQ